MLRFTLLLAALMFASCASNKAVTRDHDKVNEVMITFVQRAQAGFWKEAMASVTPIEAAEMMEDGLVVLPEYRDAVGRIRLSNIRSMNLGLDSKKRLVGLRAALDESNNQSRAPDTQANLDMRSFENRPPPPPKREEPKEAAPKQEDGFSSFIESFIKETVPGEEEGSGGGSSSNDEEEEDEDDYY
ncbi:MAG: hypothetical protein LBU89_06120 [Fibromonadaceae bacterium]|jgi:hypothetical protein|nr:hypothetical protein [Fibromonadaceae bacterium]